MNSEETQMLSAEGRRRQKLTLAVLFVTLCVGIFNIYGMLTYPVRVDNRIQNLEGNVKINAARIDVTGDRMKAVEDYRLVTQGKLDLVTYQIGEIRVQLDHISEKLNVEGKQTK